MNALRRLYWGETDVDFVGNARIWLTISGILIVGSILAFGIRGLNYSIEFAGGTAWVVTAEGFTTDDAKDVVGEFDVGPVTTQAVGGDAVRVESREVEPGQADEIAAALADTAGVDVAEVSKLSVGPSWGAQVTRKAVQGFVIFLVAVVIYISIRFEFKMAVVAIAEMFHDLIVTIGVYAVGGFQVSPATVIGVLTMVGYSLYDAVVVFDKVRENSPMLASGKVTYSELVNKSMNQTMTRSIATSITSILPAASLVFVGSVLLSASVLRDLALAVFVGIASGSYSSIFFAAPILARWKEREPRYAQIRAKQAARQARQERTEEPEDDKKASTPVSKQPVVKAGVGAGGGESQPPDADSDESAKSKPKKQPGRRHGRATTVSRKRRRG